MLNAAISFSNTAAEAMKFVFTAPSSPVPYRSSHALQQSPATAKPMHNENMSVQLSNVEVATSHSVASSLEYHRPTQRQVAQVVARYASIARRTQGVTTGDVAAGLRDEINALSHARMSAMSRMFPDD